MKNAKFSCRYTDMYDGEKVEAKIKVYVPDSKMRSGQKFVGLSAISVKSQGFTCQYMSIPLKALPKLIKALKKVSK